MRIERLVASTLDRITSLPIIPPDMVTFLHSRDFLFEPVELIVPFSN
jgi:hypothetical protein